MIGNRKKFSAELEEITGKKYLLITASEIGCCLYERTDGWSTATFWYEPVPSEPLPELPSAEQRIMNLEELFSN